MTQFDHQTTGFPLVQVHTQVRCVLCHIALSQAEAGLVNPQDSNAFFRNAPRECIGCHLEPQMHLNMFSSECAACHDQSSWSPALLSGTRFEHTASTGFSLALHDWDFENQPINCRDCHILEFTNFDSQVCIDCHSTFDGGSSFLIEHIEIFGGICQNCHDGADRMIAFNHNTFFPLEGRHASITCESCHMDKIFSGTPTACAGCHAEPVIHAGFFGLECQNCHNVQAWFPAQMSLHTFPLDHGESGGLECQVCHPQRYTQYTCYGCHEHEPASTAAEHEGEGIPETELSACAQCHPSGLKDG
jgi:hypothetical protein